MSSDELFSRQEALSGFPAKRASTLLFLIENRTAHLAARSLVNFSLTESTTAERDLAFIEAFSLGQAPPLSPTIQHLERYAPQWRDLVPQNPNLKAALAYAMSQKYNFMANQIPHIETALGLKQESVQRAYQRQYQADLGTIFATKLSFKERLQWLVAKTARIEDLPPFWLATLITVALGLPQAFLALPIAAASMGALSSLVLVIGIGIVNVVTMACMAEAIARSGDFHYGKALIKDLAANYLGQAGSFILSIAVAIRVFLIALACYVGLSATMATFTPIPASIWAALLFGVGIYLLSRQSLKFTVAIMVLLAGINVALLLGLSLLAFTHIEINNLVYLNLPWLNNDTFQISLIQQVFGVSLMLYFGHVYVGECAKLVLPKDHSASSLIKGTITGTIILTVLFCIWIVAVNGAIAPSLLATQSGTVLEPLAQQIGSIVTVAGSILVIFLLGMAWIRSSNLLFNITQEWIPHRRQTLVRLPCKSGRIILHPPGKRNFPRLGITYLGLKHDIPQFCLDIQTERNLVSTNFSMNKSWELAELSKQFPELRKLSLKLELRSLTKEQVDLKVNSNLLLNYEGMLSNTEINSIEFNPKNTDHKNNKQNKVLQRRFLIGMIPLVIVFLLTEWLFFAQTQSFTSVLAFAGVLGNSLVGGIFPVLLLLSSRRKGELIPATVIDRLDRPWLLAGIYSLFVGILLVHGLFIWHDAIARFSALAVAVLAVGATLITFAAGALTPRTVVEFREQTNLNGKTLLNITAGGKPKTTAIRLGYEEGEQQYQDSTLEVNTLSPLRYIICQLTTKGREELKVWTHCSQIDGNNHLPTLLEVYQGDKKMQYDLKLSGGKVLLPAMNSGDRWLKFKF
jgi:multisubunit Na+/H+ antiporter MnhC subunit